MDVKIIFTINTIILAIISIVMIINYLKYPKNSSIKYLSLFIILHFIGFIGFIFRNQIPDFLSIVIANTLFAAGTLSLYLSTRAITKQKPIWNNRYFIPLFTYFIGFIIFTYVEYDTSIRVFIYYLFCFIYTLSIAWLFWFSSSVKYKIFDRASALFFAALAIIFLGVVFQATFIKIQAYYFSNANTFMLLSILAINILCVWSIVVLRYRVKN